MTSTSSSSYAYRHDAHAGNHADVFKHVVFCNVVKEMQKKHPEGIVLVDTHAGCGIYDLTLQEPAEYQKAVMKILHEYEGSKPYLVPACVKEYIRLLLSATGSIGAKDFDLYPGSPILGQRLLRPQDEHRLCDLYIDQVKNLKGKAEFKQLNVYDPSSIEFLAPKSNKQLVVLIDPPYDSQDDFYHAKQLTESILQRDPRATIMTWIPYIHGSRYRWSFPTSMKEMAKEKAQLGRYYCSMSVATKGLMGSAMLVCNPVPAFDDIVTEKALGWLAETMNQGKTEFMTEQTMKKKKSKPEPESSN